VHALQRNKYKEASELSHTINWHSKIDSSIDKTIQKIGAIPMQRNESCHPQLVFVAYLINYSASLLLKPVSGKWYTSTKVNPSPCNCKVISINSLRVLGDITSS